MQPNQQWPNQQGPNQQWPNNPPAPLAPGVDPSGVLLDMRPDSATFWRGVGARALVLVPIVAIGIYRSVHEDGIGWAALLYLVLAAVMLVGVMIMLQTSRIVLTVTTVEKHRLLLRPRVIERQDIAIGVLVPQYTSGFNRTAPLLVLVGSRGRTLLKLSGQVFEAGALFTLAERMGLGSFDVISGLVGPRALAMRYKKIVPLVERRPVLLVVLGTVVLLVLIVVGITIFDPVPQ